MKFRIVITDRALTDLRGIRDYIAANSPHNAAKFLEKLLSQLALLETHPDAFATAREDPLVPYTLRQLVIKPYRILYRVEGKQVLILHIRHAAERNAAREELL